MCCSNTLKSSHFRLSTRFWNSAAGIWSHLATWSFNGDDIEARALHKPGEFSYTELENHFSKALGTTAVTSRTKSEGKSSSLPPLVDCSVGYKLMLLSDLRQYEFQRFFFFSYNRDEISGCVCTVKYFNLLMDCVLQQSQDIDLYSPKTITDKMKVCLQWVHSSSFTLK